MLCKKKIKIMINLINKYLNKVFKLKIILFNKNNK